MMGFILATALFLRPISQQNERYMVLFNLMVLAMALQLFSVYNNNFTRLADYCFQFIVLFMPMMLEYRHNSIHITKPTALQDCSGRLDANGQVLVYIGVTLFALYYYYSYLESSKLLLDTYKFVWEINPYAFYGG